MPGCVGEGFGEENEEAQLSAAGRSREPVLCAHPLPLPVTKPLLSPWCHCRMVTAVLPCLSPGGGTAGLPCVTRGHLCHFPPVLPQGTKTPRGSRAQLSLALSSPVGSPWVPRLGGRELLGRAGFGVLPVPAGCRVSEQPHPKSFPLAACSAEAGGCSTARVSLLRLASPAACLSFPIQTHCSWANAT